jgi:hypothetical protein
MPEVTKAMRSVGNFFIRATSLSHPLPLRPRALSAHELQSVFGDCLAEGARCFKSEECSPSNISLCILSARRNSHVPKTSRRQTLISSPRAD